MAVTYNWIHFSDLHFGADPNGWLWPNFKHKLFDDVRKLTDEIDRWDLVFFTGDLTQSGTANQFGQLSRELEKLWKILGKSGKVPQLCVIPGNHDLVRPDPTSATSMTLTKLWAAHEDIRTKFWTNPDCEYRREIDRIFSSYSAWLEACPVPLLPVTNGLLPGDFSAIHSKGDCALGIIGLNSTFLQIAAGDFKGRLDLHIAQLNALCNSDVRAWIDSNTANILLTHQPPSWLSNDALAHFRQEIYPPGRFFAQYCGHQHEPESFEITEMGGLPRRGRQVPALFGLEKVEGAPEKRVHGYTAGQFFFDQDQGVEKRWPRTALPLRNGDLKLCPDQSYDLVEDSFVITKFELNRPAPTENADTELSGDAAATEAAPQEIKPSLVIMESDAKTGEQKDQLAGCTRLNYKPTPQHAAIRKEEQSQLELELRRNRKAWLVADWGIGKEGFLGACFERLKNPGAAREIFHLQCADAEDIDSFEFQFNQQFGLSLQTFCSQTADVGDSCLVLDGIHPNLCLNSAFQRLQDIIDAMLDYSPNLKILVVSRTRPESLSNGIIELRPMEVPDVKLYLQYHPDAGAELQEEDAVYQIHERSDGLPMHVDRILESLKVSSLNSVLEAEWDRTPADGQSKDPVPRALINDVLGLANSEDKRSRRSFKLLKVLSLLPYGETIQALRHYLATEPFFLENALELRDLRLLDILPLKSILPATNVPMLDQNAPKLLKVPRQVRDYIRPLITPEEKGEIINAGADTYFGPRWRIGKIKIRALPFEYREYLNSGPGNEFAVIHDLITASRVLTNKSELRRVLKLGINYCSSLKRSDRFKDCAIVAGSVLQLIDQFDAQEQWASLALLYGACLRMTGKYDDALRYLKGAIELGADFFGEDDRAQAYLGIALTEDALENEDAAVEAARVVLAHTKETSGLHLQALSIIYENTLEEDETLDKLTELWGRAKQSGHTTLSNNLAITLSRSTSDERKKDEYFDEILKSKGDLYNHIRAIISKSERQQQSGRRMSKGDLNLLLGAYSYLYAQRFNNLFDRCHVCLWKELEAMGQIVALVRLFRHTSFVWRIRGADEKEGQYLELLRAKKPDSTESAAKRGVFAELGYYLARVAQVVTKKPA